jgi:hypothetical protein
LVHFSGFGIMHQEQSGNPDEFVKKIAQNDDQTSFLQNKTQLYNERKKLLVKQQLLKKILPKVCKQSLKICPIWSPCVLSNLEISAPGM